MKIFFKILYIIRKKLWHVKLLYLKNEILHLFPERVFFPKSDLAYDHFPTIYLDASESKIFFSRGISIRGHISLLAYDGGIIRIGEHSFFNQNCSINSLKGITIGKHCLFGENVKIYDHNHEYKDANKLISEQGYTYGNVTIEDNCWLGSNVVILKGVTVGRNSIIGANSVVNRSVPPYSLVTVQEIRSLIE